ncbi:hypothetical protein BGW80DRAFT_1563736 [Lactifluus volemus]|nr:hypothetical protein BGW80DRAFT_1563736 [Lactifluus volemus]
MSAAELSRRCRRRVEVDCVTLRLISLPFHVTRSVTSKPRNFDWEILVPSVGQTPDLTAQTNEEYIIVKHKSSSPHTTTSLRQFQRPRIRGYLHRHRAQVHQPAQPQSAPMVSDIVTSVPSTELEGHAHTVYEAETSNVLLLAGSGSETETEKSWLHAFLRLRHRRSLLATEPSTGRGGRCIPATTNEL